jgi:hypothetical protein
MLGAVSDEFLSQPPSSTTSSLAEGLVQRYYNLPRDGVALCVFEGRHAAAATGFRFPRGG